MVGYVWYVSLSWNPQLHQKHDKQLEVDLLMRLFCGESTGGGRWEAAAWEAKHSSREDIATSHTDVPEQVFFFSGQALESEDE